MKDKSIVDSVTHAEMQDELERLRSAIILLANCVGANIISQDNARRIVELLKSPNFR